jgi:hypothetical protein
VMDERQSEISCVELTERGKGKEGKQRWRRRWYEERRRGGGR